MSRRKSSEKPSVAPKKSRVEHYVEEFDDNPNYDDLAFVPDPDHSDLSDEDSDSEISDSEDENIDFVKNKVSYTKIFENYDSKQKLLEPDYIFEWTDGEKMHSGDLGDEIVLTKNQEIIILNSTPTELFEYFFSNSMKQYILEAVRENEYDLSMAELDVFIGIVITSSVTMRHSSRDYWSKDSRLRCNDIVSAMSRNKFEKIKSKLKYSKSNDRNDADRAWRVRKLLDLFRENIARFGFFGTALSIDEMMIKFYGRSSMKQFIRTKPIRFGIKFWALCTSAGFLLDLDIYAGKNNLNSTERLASCALGSRVVMQMANRLLTNVVPHKLQRYHLYFDNFFTSADLVLHLHKAGLRCTGTIRQDRIKEKHNFDKKASRGTFQVSHEKNSGINLVTVMDSKPISLLSTATGATPFKTVKRYSREQRAYVEHQFPCIIQLYNKFMGGVDLSRQPV